MKTIYFELQSGISGDMAVAALIDLGVDENHIKSELCKLEMDDFELVIKRDKKQGISGINVEVIVKEQKKTRTLTDILLIIERSSLNQTIKELSKDIFNMIGLSESKVHNVDINEVHFHEIGAVDSIVDIVALSICIDYLKPDRILSSYVNVGKGHIICDHGIMPVPTPATVEILKNVPIYSGEQEGELVTPTGAAIIKRLADKFENLQNLKISKIGIGIGKKDFKYANVLRVFLSEEEQDDKMYIVETNIDDMNPEMYETVIEELYNCGAVEAYMQPVIMKKQRPGNILSAICNEKAKGSVETAILTSTSTFGLRSYEVSRKILDRSFETRRTRYGDIKIKRGYLDGKLIKEKVEYEDLKRISKETGKSIREILLNIGKG